ncbi:MAG TPA: GNAT family N-acetyltransferase [Selenomonadales bacterium]|nr:GNAT family N-acetyltransferase [Selenomonadales bacterium]
MLTITPVEAGDLPELARLYEELVAVEIDLAKMREIFARIAVNPSQVVLAAKDGQNRLVGSVMGVACDDIIGVCRPFLVIENMIVAQTCRGQGVGRKLMDGIEAWGRDRNCYFAMLTSMSHRKEAHRFYASLGYDSAVAKGFKKYL